MKDIIGKKLNKHLTGYIEYKWESIMEDADFSQISAEQLGILKAVFHLGYQTGYEDNFQELKEVYKNDWIMLVDLFEELK
ncbi:hypothetical protein NSQ62_08275 [Solibacillus sp. FSL H8-0523]|uniref:hypothetical protein n=1 Tax=Solibacillus sp. FSL H8-0523 TaxID=2954511 RepID=UPI00310127EB